MSRLTNAGLVAALSVAAWGCSPSSERDCIKEAAETAKTEIAFRALRAACEKEFAPPPTPEDPSTNEALATEAAANNSIPTAELEPEYEEYGRGGSGGLFTPEPNRTYTK